MRTGDDGSISTPIAGYGRSRASAAPVFEVAPVAERGMPSSLSGSVVIMAAWETVDNRKDLLLLVLAAEDGAPVVGVTRLQKYLYLLQDQHGWRSRLKTTYDFRAYDFGPFDDQLYADLDFLENIGLIKKTPAGEEPPAENGEQRATADSWATSDPEFAPWEEDDATWQYRLTSKGRDFVGRLRLDRSDREAIEDLKRQWNGRPLAQFLRWLYTTYPDTAVNTKLTHLRSS